MDEKDRFERGVTQRRKVLGGAHVDRSIAAKTDFNAEFQDLITRYAWGEIWSRPGLDRRTRSCITLATLAALSHEKVARQVLDDPPDGDRPAGPP